MTPTRCPKCEGSLVEGFIVDEGHGTYHVTAWQAGQPKRSFWFGIKSSKRDRLKTSTWRCQRCGYLESYARGQ